MDTVAIEVFIIRPLLLTGAGADPVRMRTSAQESPNGDTMALALAPSRSHSANKRKSGRRGRQV
jgi:hypothetical protein